MWLNSATSSGVQPLSAASPTAATSAWRRRGNFTDRFLLGRECPLGDEDGPVGGSARRSDDRMGKKTGSARTPREGSVGASVARSATTPWTYGALAAKLARSGQDFAMKP